MRLVGTLLLGGLLVLASCSDEERTQVMLTIDSDLAGRDALESLRIRVEGPDGETQTSSADLADAPLPRSLALLHEGGALGPFVASAQGLRGGDVVLSRQARFEFQRGRTLVLPLNLVERCVDVACDEGQTCAEQGCRPVEVQPDELRPWSGEAPELMLDAALPEGGSDAGGRDGSPAEEGGTDGSMDGGPDDAGEPDGSSPEEGGTDGSRDATPDAMPDAGPDAMPDAQADAMPDAMADACVPMPEQCNGMDDDCNGFVDEDFDLQNDHDNCGTCGNDCGEQRCMGGTCQDCLGNTADCDGDNVCDALTSKQNCGACGNFCQGMASCVAGSCQ